MGPEGSRTEVRLSSAWNISSQDRRVETRVCDIIVRLLLVGRE